MTVGRAVGRTDGPRTTPPYDLAAVRAQFPILARPVRGQRLAYLDNASTAQKPLRVVDTLRRFYVTSNANVHRGVHLLSEEATDAYDQARERMQRFLGARFPEEIILTHGTTAGLNLVAASWAGVRLRPGDEIVLTTMEHHSNIIPWQQAAERTGAVLKVVPTLPDGALDLPAFRRLLGHRTRIVAVSHASNVLGTVAPVREMAALAHDAGAVLVVDGAQSAPHLPVDVTALDCDFFACSGHKLYGPTGIGVLYGKRELLEEMPPWQTGGGMIEEVTFERTTWAPPPARFEAGTPPIAGAVGLAAAADFLEELGWEGIIAHETALLAYATEQLVQVPGVRLHGTAPGKLGVISFTVDGIHPHDVATVLDAGGVAVRAGHHCAQPLMRHLGVTATVRASLGLYNDAADVDQLIEGLHETHRRFGR